MKPFYRFFALFCGVLCLASPVLAQNDVVYAQAIAAYEKQDFQAAFALLKPLAEQGDKVAQHNLAVLYQEGLGVPADAVKALYWYEKAAEQGEAEAQFQAALMYSQGEGAVQNYPRAVYWYEKAAAQEHPEAQNNLAARYATGTGVARDIELAQKWYERAAANGNAAAAYTLQQLKQQFTMPKNP
ncbi:MAG: tetratricopeptide repeat protein [Alysiella sp.]|uniref:tetratricopeptide repeat protein n=1 Tax=Alysiella sp. TaxID=1872483 RepID=UPI0026DC9933|nr:tetratricopeptide repeat protein [Alysiella sp.]MDO4434153.1 tetratricopeptide repeat protein [Alysiella sp.]